MSSRRTSPASLPPIAVWRFVITELAKLLILTASILVVVIAFAATVKPLADGKLGPLDALKFMALAVPPMLMYALPFAAGFSATLVYHRMGSDNELTACHAGGVSHRALLVPALAIGLLLSIITLTLSASIVPRFLRNMEELIRLDVTRLFITSLNTGDSVRVENRQITADFVERIPEDRRPPQSHPNAPKPDQVLYFQNLLVVEFNDEGDVIWQAAANKAWAWLYRANPETDLHDENTAATIPPQNTSSILPAAARIGGAPAARETSTVVIIRCEGLVALGTEAAIQREQGELPPLTIPNALRDDPKFLPAGELSRLRDQPERMNFVDERRRLLASRLAQQASIEAARESFQNTQTLVLTDHAGRTVTINASDLRYDPAVRGQRLAPPDGRREIRVVTIEDDGSRRERTAPTAYLNFQAEAGLRASEVAIKLTLEDVTTTGLHAPNTTPAPEAMRRSRAILDHLNMADGPVDDLLDKPASKLIKIADEYLARFPPDHPGATYIRAPRDDLERRIERLRWEITSKQHERYASSVACLVMIVTGAVLAMRLRNALPLTVYLWSFFPALAAVLSISIGQQLVHRHGLIGMPVLWGGVAALTTYALIEFKTLAKH